MEVGGLGRQLHRAALDRAKAAFATVVDALGGVLQVDPLNALYVPVLGLHSGNKHVLGFVVADGADYLPRLLADKRTFAFVFADAWAGKYHHLEEALQLLTAGGIYVVDDMLPQPNWPEDHPAKVATLVDTLVSHPDFQVARLDWSTGVIIATKTHDRTHTGRRK